MENKRFTRNKENFHCDHCNYFVEGTGYTNHCPKCLWSKHVDINPGDRAAMCHGLMEPVDVETRKGEQVILHRCQACKVEKRNKLQEGDNMNTVIAVVENKALQ